MEFFARRVLSVGWITVALTACGSGTTSVPPADVPPASDVLVEDLPSEPRPNACTNPRVTSDCASEAIATGICLQVVALGGVCHTCVQSRDSSGNPRVWMAVETEASCGCGPVPAGTFPCGSIRCAVGREVCVMPSGPGICPMPDAGSCPPGCPGCPSIEAMGTCHSIEGCAAGDCECESMRRCITRMGTCDGAPASGVTVYCMAG